jgi:hypothetical protein
VQNFDPKRPPFRRDYRTIAALGQVSSREHLLRSLRQDDIFAVDGDAQRAQPIADARADQALSGFEAKQGAVGGA